MKNNKGFSLVELIIVVAIMAVLIGVLAPQYLKYVEKSRVSSDKTAISAVVGAVNTSLSDEDVYSDVSTSGSVSISATGAVSCGDTALQTAIHKICGSTVSLASKAYKGKSFTISYSFDGENWEVDSIEKVLQSGS